MKGKNTCSECLKNSKKWFEENCVDGRYKKYTDTYKKHQHIGYEKRRKLKLYTRLLKVFYYILEGENKMKKFQIWESDFNQNSDRGGMLIPESEIYKVVDMYNQSCMVINGVSVDLADILTKTIKTFNEKINDVTIMEEFLTEQCVKFTSIDWLPDLPVHQELLYFDTYNQQFDDLSLCDYIDAYDWHDGSNHKIETAHDSITVTKIVTEDTKYLDLDEWDQRSNGFCTGGRQFYHETVYRVIELDDSKVDNMYMLCQWSQWQGDHETAKILSKDELESHLEEIGYKID